MKIIINLCVMWLILIMIDFINKHQLVHLLISFETHVLPYKH